MIGIGAVGCIVLCCLMWVTCGYARVCQGVGVKGCRGVSVWGVRVCVCQCGGVSAGVDVRV